MFARIRPPTLSATSIASKYFHRPFLRRSLVTESDVRREHHPLNHVDLTSKGGPKSYKLVEQYQEQLRNEHLNYKSTGHLIHAPRPPPRILTFESAPTITLGRRQDLSTNEPDFERLLRPVDVNLPNHKQPINRKYDVECTKSSRGGLTTYHGPGQLVCWPIIDMASPEYPRYTVISYAEQLEHVTARVLWELYRIRTMGLPDQPGVWVSTPESGLNKIAALGVHHRRHVTSFGIAINIDIAVKGGEEENTWSRFVPCGLQGMGVTSVADQIGHEKLGRVDMSAIASHWAHVFHEGLHNPEKRSSHLPVGEGDALRYHHFR